MLSLFIVATTTSLVPFTPRQSLNSVFSTGEGDIFRQLSYCGIFIAAIVPAVRRRPSLIIAALPVSMVALFLWSAATLYWSPVPLIGARRLALTVIIAWTAFIIVANLTLERGLQVIGQTLIGLAVASVLTGVLVPTLGIHQPGDPESQIVGAWRGVFYHKNILGSVSALAVLFSLYFLPRDRRPQFREMLSVLLSAGALALAGSKTSILLCLVAAVCFWLASNHRGAAQVKGVLVLLVFPITFVLVLSLPYGLEAVEEIVDDPQLFTGRSLLWQLTYEVGMQNLLFGVGYQSIFQVGPESAMARLTGSLFIQTITHAHNAYLEIWASTGIIGLCLFGYAVVVRPLLAITSRHFDEQRRIFIAVYVFVLLHALLESGLLDRERGTWVVLLCIMGLLHSAWRKRKVQTVVLSNHKPVSADA